MLLVVDERGQVIERRPGVTRGTERVDGPSGAVREMVA
jgi:hypothetical protein